MYDQPLRSYCKNKNSNNLKIIIQLMYTGHVNKSRQIDYANYDLGFEMFLLPTILSTKINMLIPLHRMFKKCPDKNS